ncbi:Pkinase-domain-containing protein [Backusella circina FSU 941]|nr:Pkinase-domain-containing protein [Backusella circina FSU 941]
MSSTKRPNESDATLSRKQSKIEITDEKTENVPRIPIKKQHQPIARPDDFEPEQPDFENNKRSYAFLQSFCPKYKSVYLNEKSTEEAQRAGFLLGRAPQSDIMLKEQTISSRHCIFYMESGSSGNNRGIRIYVEDISLNGTFVNNKAVGLYRILLPSSYRTEKCQNLFEFGEKLGFGNFAEVFKGTEKATGRTIAIKSISFTRYATKPKVLHAIIQEVSTLMSLESHPFIIKMEKTFVEDEKIYLILEYAKDGDLYKSIERKQLTEDECRFIFWQLFSATKFLHDRAIVHRDLKPENVLMVDKEKLHVKITDFGLARVKQRGEYFMSQCGTPNYVAPEILESASERAYGDKCDLWSLGVMLFVSLCGYPPFNDHSEVPLKTQIKRGAYEFLSPFWNDISEEAKDLITCLMNIDPSDRIDIPEALPEDLEQRKDGLGADIINLADKFNEVNEIYPTAPITKSM